jgi:hypothetical protein
LKLTAVSVIRGTDELGLLSQAELGNTLIPSLDDSADTDRGDERLTSVPESMSGRNREVISMGD